MDKKFLGLFFLFFLAFTLFVSLVVFNKPITQFTKATEELTPSSETSHIFAWPLTVAADGKSESEINVFVQNKNKNPVSTIINKVTLQTTLGQIREKNISDDDKKLGKASFIVTSTEPGIAEITAKINDSVLVKQKVTIKFE